MLRHQADVVLRFVDEEPPAVIQPNTLYVPKPEIQVTLMKCRGVVHFVRKCNY